MVHPHRRCRRRRRHGRRRLRDSRCKGFRSDGGSQRGEVRARKMTAAQIASRSRGRSRPAARRVRRWCSGTARRGRLGRSTPRSDSGAGPVTSHPNASSGVLVEGAALLVLTQRAQTPGEVVGRTQRFGSSSPRSQRHRACGRALRAVARRRARSATVPVSTVIRSTKALGWPVSSSASRCAKRSGAVRAGGSEISAHEDPIFPTRVLWITRSHLSGGHDSLRRRRERAWGAWDRHLLTPRPMTPGYSLL
jgi:hypothetical protein